MTGYGQKGLGSVAASLKRLAATTALGTIAAAAFAAGAPNALAFAIDGNLNEFTGIKLKDFTAACGTDAKASCIGSDGTTVPTTVNGSPAGAASGISVTEDTNDVSNNYQVGPNAGGQNFDVEFLGAGIYGLTDRTLYIAIASGQRPDNGFAKFEPGDIRIRISNSGGGYTTYGIEVGGCAAAFANGATSCGDDGKAIGVGAAGTTYNLTNGQGGTIGDTLSISNTAAGHTAGTIWRTGDALPDTSVANYSYPGNTVTVDAANGWRYDPLYGCGDGTDYCGKQPVQLLGGTAAGTVTDYIFTRNQTYQYNAIDPAADCIAAPATAGCVASLQHSVIEVALDLNALLTDPSGPNYTLDNAFSADIQIFWGESCGNDILSVALPATFQPNLEIPAPAGLAFFGLGALGFGLLRRRRAA